MSISSTNRILNEDVPNSVDSSDHIDYDFVTYRTLEPAAYKAFKKMKNQIKIRQKYDRLMTCNASRHGKSSQGRNGL